MSKFSPASIIVHGVHVLLRAHLDLAPQRLALATTSVLATNFGGDHDVAVAQQTGTNMGCPGKWKHGPKPAVPWWFNFAPHPCEQLTSPLKDLWEGTTPISHNQGTHICHAFCWEERLSVTWGRKSKRKLGSLGIIHIHVPCFKGVFQPTKYFHRMNTTAQAWPTHQNNGFLK